MFHKKHYTLIQAQAILPEIKIKLTRIVQLKNILDDKGYDVSKYKFLNGISSNGTGEYPNEMEELKTIVNEILQEEILIKGLDNGLIDFPHIRNNKEEVYLCYLLGEDDIRFWHRIGDGFAGRKPIEEI